MKCTIVSVIIVNYKTSHLIRNCLDSFLLHSNHDWVEIIIVDNDSQDNIKDVVDSIYNKRPNFSIKLLELNTNLGFGKANNKGIEVATGDAYFFLNPDTLLLNDAVSILTENLFNNPKYGIVGGNVLDEDLLPAFSYNKCFPSIIYLLGNILLFGRYESIIYGKNAFFNNSVENKKVAYITGADLMIKKEIITDSETFNPKFFMYFEEVELCHRIHKKGYDIISVPQASIQHLEGKSCSNIAQKANMRYNGIQIYFQLTHSKIYCKLINVLLLIMSFLKILYSSITKDNDHMIFWKTFYNEIINKKISCG